jgi:thiol-disulfide isomerase/thioredoxin
MKRYGAVALTLLLLVLSGAAAGAGEAVSDEARLGDFIPAAAPQPAPHVAFADLAGHTVHLRDFAGRLVLVNLWATWCAPCREEMPSLVRLKQSLGDRITILAISEDRSGAGAVEPFLRRVDLGPLKVYVDPQSEVGAAFAVRGLPTSVLIDGKGLVVGRVEGGAQWDTPAMLDVLRRFLPRTAPVTVIKSSFSR